MKSWREAIAEGYTNKHDPYHGYYFRVLTAQGPHASGGEMSYLDNGLMTKGFALIAWPSNYGFHRNHDVRCGQDGDCLSEGLGPEDRRNRGRLFRL